MLGLLGGAVRTISGWMGTGQKVEGLSIPECPSNPAERRRVEGERACDSEELSSEGKFKEANGDLGLFRRDVYDYGCVCAWARARVVV